jgi:hypothetical protein
MSAVKPAEGGSPVTFDHDHLVQELTELARRANPQLDAELAVNELRNDLGCLRSSISGEAGLHAEVAGLRGDLRQTLTEAKRLEAGMESLSAKLEALPQAAGPSTDHAQIPKAFIDILEETRNREQRKTKALWELSQSVCGALRELEGFTGRVSVSRQRDFEPLWDNLLGRFENQGISRIAPRLGDSANPEEHQTEDGRVATGKVRRTLRTGFRSSSGVLLKAVVDCEP